MSYAHVFGTSSARSAWPSVGTSCSMALVMQILGVPVPLHAVRAATEAPNVMDIVAAGSCALYVDGSDGGLPPATTIRCCGPASAPEVAPVCSCISTYVEK